MKTRRERLRSRFHVAALVGGFLLLAGCSHHFGPGLTELAAGRGWQPLPIESWVLNDGLEASAIVFCPRESCVRPAMAAVLTISGRDALAMDEMLNRDPAQLAREFARPKAAAKPASKTAKAPSRPAAPKSATSVARYDGDGVPGVLVEIRALEGPHYAATAILRERKDDRLTLAIATSNDANAARDYARAAWRSR